MSGEPVKSWETTDYTKHTILLRRAATILVAVPGHVFKHFRHKPSILLQGGTLAQKRLVGG
eukprot:390137-Prorocentrum_lima.AAC.1